MTDAEVKTGDKPTGDVVSATSRAIKAAEKPLWDIWGVISVLVLLLIIPTLALVIENYLKLKNIQNRLPAPP
jgi:hypothetical protein